MSDWQHQEIFKGMLNTIIESLKMVAWINGGAAIGILTYLGNTLSHGLPVVGANIKTSILWYCAGLASATLAFIFGYLTELTLWGELQRRAAGKVAIRYHHIGIFITCGLAIFGVIAFLGGSLNAANVLTQSR
jgi:hypothetical protein